MNYRNITQGAVLVLFILFIVWMVNPTFSFAAVNPQLHWKDSYSANGSCYCDSNFDHGIASKVVNGQTVQQICAAIGPGPGASGNPIYNDVQCGNGPPNNSPSNDEVLCPGRVDQGSSGCAVIGPLWPSDHVPQPVTQSSGDCTVYGTQEDSLFDVRDLFESQCGSVATRDCDSLEGRWFCSSKTIGKYSSRGQLASVPNFIPTITTEENNSDDGNSDSSGDPSTSHSINVYQYAPANEGWIEANIENPDGSPFIIWGGAQEPQGGRGEFTIPFSISEGGRYRVSIISKLEDPAHPTDGNDAFLRLNSGGSLPDGLSLNEWFKSFQNGTGWISSIAYQHNLQRGSIIVDFPVGEHSVSISGRSPGFAISALTVTIAGASVPVEEPEVPDNGTILYSLHHDFAPDTDDFMAITANRMIADEFNLEPMVVIGTYGNSLKHLFVNSSINHTRSLFPLAFDAHNDRANTIDIVSDRWATRIASGGSVRVSDGGPSDFTADVLRHMALTNPNIDRKKIIVVQHSHGFNEDNTSAANVAYIIQHADYRRIDNGNLGGNSTADFNNSSTDGQCVSLLSAANSTPYGSQWQFSASLLPNNRKCDFSDSVEFLYTLGETTTKTMNQFINKYFN